jgi:hypothetical protein
VDIDHTVSDAAWRDHLLPPPGSDDEAWDAYHRDVLLDEPIVEVVELLQVLVREAVMIYAVTGRNERYRRETEAWLTRHGVPVFDVIMRGDGDRRSSGEFKLAVIRELFPNIDDVMFILEDRPRVVEALRVLGRPILQVHAGERRTHHEAEEREGAAADAG